MLASRVRCGSEDDATLSPPALRNIEDPQATESSSLITVEATLPRQHDETPTVP